MRYMLELVALCAVSVNDQSIIVKDSLTRLRPPVPKNQQQLCMPEQRGDEWITQD